MKKWLGHSIGFAFAAGFICLPSLGAQALGNWSSPRSDMQHDGWQKAETTMSKDVISSQFKFLWKIKLGGATKDVMSYGEPILVPRLINAKGFKDFVLWAGPQDLYAVDSELGTMLWTKHIDTAPSSCSPTNMGVIAEAPLTINFRARRAPGAPPPPPQQPPMTESERRIGVSPGGGGFGIKGIYFLAGDGYLHEQVIATGADFAPPVKFLPGAAGVSNGLGLDGKTIYTTTKVGCSGSQNALWAMNMDGKTYSVSGYKMGSISPLVAMGPTLDNNVAYVVTGAGKSDASTGVYANSIVALDPEAKVKDWYEASGSLQNVSPVVFTYKQKKMLAAPGKDCSYVLLDAESLGGADHHTPVAGTACVSKAKSTSVSALASWQNAEDTWILASVPGPVNSEVKFENSDGSADHGSVVAFKVEEISGKTTLVPAWVSRDLINPAPPVIANGLVIALSQGDASTHATLYVLDAMTGKELYSSKETIPTYAHMAGVVVGDGHAFFVTHDNVLYSFGIGIEH